MNTDEKPATAEPRSYGQNAPSTSQPEEASPQDPVMPGADDFHPAVLAVSRLKTSGRTYAKRTKITATSNELARISAELINTLSSDDDLETSLRTQSALINHAFTALLMKATRDDIFDEDAFASAMRAQRQYRMTCQTLTGIKKAQEQTEMNRQKALSLSRPRDRFTDPYAHQYAGKFPGL